MRYLWLYAICASLACFVPASAKPKASKASVVKVAEPPVPAKWDARPMFHRGGQFRRYDGNPNWNPTTVYTSDSELGTPSHLSMPHYGPYVEAEGRRVRVVTRLRSALHYPVPDLPEAKYFQNVYLLDNTLFVGLEDDKGNVLLPCVFEKVVAVPGRGVFLQSHLKYKVWESYSLATGRREVRDDIIDIRQFNPKPWPSYPFNAELPDTFVLITRLPETVNLSVQSLKSLQPGHYEIYEDVSPASLVPPTDDRRETKPAPLAQVEVRSLSGQLLARYDKVAPVQAYFRLPPSDKNQRYTSPKFEYFGPVRDWRQLHPVSPTGELCLQLLDKQWQTVGTPLPLAYRTQRPLDLLMKIPAGEDLYWALTDDGTFAPWPGTLGFRSLDLSPYNYDPACTVAYETPEGLRFGWLNPQTGESSGPIWKDVRRLKTPALEVGESLIGPTVAAQMLDGKWKIIDAYAPSRNAGDPKRNVFPVKYGKVKFGRDEWSHFVNLLAEREQESVKARADNEASFKWAQFFHLGKLPSGSAEEREAFARQYWESSVAMNSQSGMEAIANAMGGNYLAQWIDRNAKATVAQLESAVAGASDAALRAKLQARLTQRQKEAAQEAAARIAAIEAEKRRLAANNANNTSSPNNLNWNAWSNWASARDSGPSYAERSAASASRLQSMHNYLYGKSNNPLLNPFKSWK